MQQLKRNNSGNRKNFALDLPPRWVRKLKSGPNSGNRKNVRPDLPPAVRKSVATTDFPGATLQQQDDMFHAVANGVSLRRERPAALLAVAFSLRELFGKAKLRSGTVDIFASVYLRLL
jgi:hypothetical protein